MHRSFVSILASLTTIQFTTIDKSQLANPRAYFWRNFKESNLLLCSIDQPRIGSVRSVRSVSTLDSKHLGNTLSSIRQGFVHRLRNDWRQSQGCAAKPYASCQSTLLQQNRGQKPSSASNATCRQRAAARKRRRKAALAAPPPKSRRPAETRNQQITRAADAAKKRTVVAKTRKQRAVAVTADAVVAAVNEVEAQENLRGQRIRTIPSNPLRSRSHRQRLPTVPPTPRRRRCHRRNTILKPARISRPGSSFSGELSLLVIAWNEACTLLSSPQRVVTDVW